MITKTPFVIKPVTGYPKTGVSQATVAPWVFPSQVSDAQVQGKVRVHVFYLKQWIIYPFVASKVTPEATLTWRREEKKNI